MNQEKISNNAKAKTVSFDMSHLPDLNARKYAAPLPILYSCRIRLNEEQRTTLKRAWNEHRNSFAPPQTDSLPGSTISTQTAFQQPGLPGLSALVVSDIIGSRESIALTTILNISAALGVEIVDRLVLQEAFDSYLDFVSSEAKRLYGKS